MSNLVAKIKDYITDLIGLAIIIVTLIMFFNGKVVLLWDGLILLGVGAVFFILPDKAIADYLQRLADKHTGKKEDKP
jgi:hypothetical protein